jgi:hypothetical protein
VKRDEDDQVNLLLILYIVLQNTNKNTKLMKWIREKGLAISRPGVSRSWVINIFDLAEFQQDVFLIYFWIL